MRTQSPSSPFLFALLLPVAWVAGCGGPPSCPAGAPPNGSACSDINFVCESGGSAHRRCSSLATCLSARDPNDPGALAWSVPDNSSCSAQNDAMCATSFTGTQVGQACPAQGLSCDYAEGRCSCSPCNPTPGLAWQCRKWGDNLNTECPSERPVMGTACAINADITCRYDNACTVSFGLDVVCRNERWQPRTGARTTCAAPVCGISN